MRGKDSKQKKSLTFFRNFAIKVKDNSKHKDSDDEVSLKTLLIVFFVGLLIIAALFIFNNFFNHDSFDNNLIDESNELLDEQIVINNLMNYEAEDDIPAYDTAFYNFSAYDFETQKRLASCSLKSFRVDVFDCFVFVAVSLNDSSICKHLLPSRTDACIRDYAIDKLSFETCNTINNSHQSFLCEVRISAIINGDDLSFCENAYLENDKIASCLKNFAKVTGDLNYCDMIENYGLEFLAYQNMCYRNLAILNDDSSFCKFISSEDAKTKCSRRTS